MASKSLAGQGVGFITDFFGDLRKAIKHKGGNPDAVLESLRQEAMVGRIADMLLEGVKKVDNLFSLTIDYGKTLAQMVADGKYDWVNSDITKKNFPIKESGTQSVSLELVHLNRTISTQDILTELANRGLRPATLPELLAFGAAFPDEQRKYPIVALGSVWQRWDGYRFVSYLWIGADERVLSLSWYGNDWSSGYRFAAVRK